ncbi:MAG: hypothetical protein J6A59_04840 [Lachnospiraceae bacterium]|nr:hypothetical protein [Lachnospiraceae bacterium]
MKKVIFAKCSNDRADRFKILTKIIDDNGHRYVEKHPLHKAAQAHIDSLSDTCVKLKELTDNTVFAMNNCNMDNGVACFEYLQGKTLEDIMKECFFKEDYEGLYKLFDRFVENIQALADCKFTMSEGFEEVFGAVDISEDEAAVSVADIDLVTSNIIVDEQAWHVIDYEWTFDFAVPVRFIIYRSIYGFMHVIGNYGNCEKLKLYDRVSMDQEEVQQYQLMEEAFQRYVADGYYTLNQMYGVFGKRCIKVCDMVGEQLNDIPYRELLEEKNLLSDDKAKLEEENARLKAELEEIYKSKKWKLVQKLAKLRTGGK